jgi:hypothetical protein
MQYGARRVAAAQLSDGHQERHGWTPQLRDGKIDQPASVIVVDHLVDRVNAALPAPGLQL